MGEKVQDVLNGTQVDEDHEACAACAGESGERRYFPEGLELLKIEQVDTGGDDHSACGYAYKERECRDIETPIEHVRHIRDHESVRKLVDPSGKSCNHHG